MSLLSIEVTNLRPHSHLKIDLNGKSALLLGDSGLGKSAILDVVAAHMGFADYPKDPLLPGEKEGKTRTVHLGKDGKQYTVERTFVRLEDDTVKVNRMKVYSQDGGAPNSLTQMHDTLFGNAFKNKVFDYIEYFYKQLSFEARAKYFFEAIANAEMQANSDTIESLVKERGAIGTDLEKKEAIWRNTQYNEDTLEEDLDKYSRERDFAEAEQAKQHHLKALIDLTAIQKELDEHNDAVEEISKLDLVKNEYEVEIDKLAKRIEELKNGIKKLLVDKSTQSKKVLSETKLKKLNKKADEAVTKNVQINTEATEVYTKTLEEISNFKVEKKAFFDGVKAYEEYDELRIKHEAKDAEIKAIKEKNQALLQKLLPLPELSIGEKNGKPIVLYNGRDFSMASLSTGEAIEIAAKIQQKLNPSSDNFIIIPEAQSMGSKIDDVLNSCKQFNIQYLVEFTERSDFRVEIVEK